MTKQEFKETCIQLRNQNYTLGEMVKILNRPKTTIYFHVRKIPVSQTLKEKIGQISREIAARVHPPKGISILNRHCSNFGKWTKEKVSLVAHAMFDGEIKHEGVVYNNRSRVLIENFKKKMGQIYSYAPRVYLNKETGVIRLGYYNVELGSLFKIKAPELVKNILSFNLDLQRAFLIAFFNDEGGVYLSGTKRRIKGYQHDDPTLFLVQKILKNFGIESVVSTRFHEIIIGRRKNLEKFAQEINFTPGVCVNGQRSNSIWKKSLEKREILNMALKSYQT